MRDPVGSFALRAWAYPIGGQNPDGIGDSIANKHEAPQSGVCIVSYSISYNASTNQFYGEICNSADVNNPEVIVPSTDTYPLERPAFCGTEIFLLRLKATGQDFAAC